MALFVPIYGFDLPLALITTPTPSRAAKRKSVTTGDPATRLAHPGHNKCIDKGITPKLRHQLKQSPQNQRFAGF
ncbi:TPA: hypothetical protein ACRMRV_006479, partial [Pseudomonas aeruginosa]